MKHLLTILLTLCFISTGRAGEKRYWPLEINGVLLGRIQLALNIGERSRGLMHRNALADDEGMLFIFPKEETVSFWMKNTRIPLDIIFLDSRDTIIAMHSMPVEPRRLPYEDQLTYEQRLPLYSSGRPAIAALELKQGMIQLLRLKTGMKLPLNRKLLTWPVY